MLVQVVDVFDDVLTAGHAEVVEHGEVLDVLTETNTASVRADGDFVTWRSMRRMDRISFTPGHTAGVDLTDVHRSAHYHLLEHHSVVGHLSATTAGSRNRETGRESK